MILFIFTPRIGNETSAQMKICIVAWEMLETGGIIRVITGYQTGFEKLGYEVVTYLASKNGRLQVFENEFNLMTKWFRPKGQNLGWDNPAQMKQFRSVVKDCDFVLSVHGCPHPTKSGAGDDRGWQQIYKIARKYAPVGIVFTDTNWDVNYPWIEEVIKKNTKVFYNNWNAQFTCMHKLKQESVFVDYPIDVDEVREPMERNLDVSWIPQWKRGKGLYEFIRELATKKHKFRTAMFNTGIEYYNARLKDEWNDAIRKDYFMDVVHNPESQADYYGILYPDQMGLVYAKSKMTLDLSGAYVKRLEGLYTCTMAESMIHGSVVAVSPDSITSERSRIQGLPIAYMVDKDDLIGSLYEGVEDKTLRTNIQKQAREWAMENCTDVIVCQKMADYMMEKK